MLRSAFAGGAQNLHRCPISVLRRIAEILTIKRRPVLHDPGAGRVQRDHAGTVILVQVVLHPVLNVGVPGATGDFYGVGTFDILWQNSSTGLVAIWEMNGSTPVGFGRAAAMCCRFRLGDA